MVGCDYSEYGPEMTLAGTLADAASFAAAAAAAGVTVVSLTGNGATREAILGALGEAAQLTAPGEQFLFYFSGHGTVVAEQEEGVVPTADDIVANQDSPAVAANLVAYEECIVPQDYLSGGLIANEELGEIWARFAAGTVVWTVLDSCHSRDASDAQAAALAHIPADICSVAACLDDKTSLSVPEGQLGGQWRGLFTVALVNSLAAHPHPTGPALVADILIRTAADPSGGAEGKKQIANWSTNHPAAFAHVFPI